MSDAELAGMLRILADFQIFSDLRFHSAGTVELEGERERERVRASERGSESEKEVQCSLRTGKNRHVKPLFLWEEVGLHATCRQPLNSKESRTSSHVLAVWGPVLGRKNRHPFTSTHWHFSQFQLHQLILNTHTHILYIFVDTHTHTISSELPYCRRCRL